MTTGLTEAPMVTSRDRAVRLWQALDMGVLVYDDLTVMVKHLAAAEKSAVRDFLRWLAAQGASGDGIQLTESDDGYGICAVHAPEDLLDRWLTERGV